MDTASALTKDVPVVESSVGGDVPESDSVLVARLEKKYGFKINMVRKSLVLLLGEGSPREWVFC